MIFNSIEFMNNIATRDVTYGKKYILWNIPLTFSFLILTSAFASKSEINTDNIIWCLDLILFYRIDLLASFMYEKYFFKIK